MGHKLYSFTNNESMKQCKEPESIRVWVRTEKVGNMRLTKSESGSESADALSQTKLATQCWSMQPSACEAFSRVVFKGPVYRTGKKTETGPNWTD